MWFYCIKEEQYNDKYIEIKSKKNMVKLFQPSDWFIKPNIQIKVYYYNIEFHLNNLCPHSFYDNAVFEYKNKLFKINTKLYKDLYKQAILDFTERNCIIYKKQISTIFPMELANLIVSFLYKH